MDIMKDKCVYKVRGWWSSSDVIEDLYYTDDDQIKLFRELCDQAREDEELVLHDLLEENGFVYIDFIAVEELWT